MKKIILFLTCLCITLTCSAGKVKEVARWMIPETEIDASWSTRNGDFLYSHETGTGVDVKLYKKDKLKGTYTFPARSPGDCCFVYDVLAKNKGVVIKNVEGTNAYFEIYQLKKTAELIGTYTGFTGGGPFCCPWFYVFDGGKSFGYKQRVNGSPADSIFFERLDKKMNSTWKTDIVNHGNGCVNYSPNGNYIINSDLNTQYTTEIYSAQNNVTLIHSIPNGLDGHWQFKGKKDNIVCVRTDDAYIVGALKKDYTQLYTFPEDEVDQYFLGEKGNTLVVLTNGTMKVIKKNGKETGPFDVPSTFGNSFYCRYFSKNTAIFVVESVGKINLYGYKFTSKGLKEFKDSVEFTYDSLTEFVNVSTDGKNIVVIHTQADGKQTAYVYTTKLKKVDGIIGPTDVIHVYDGHAVATDFNTTRTYTLYKY